MELAPGVEDQWVRRSGGQAVILRTTDHGVTRLDASGSLGLVCRKQILHCLIR